MAEILPSILSADFARLGDQVAVLEAVGCRALHVDVMDGHFVPNITLGPPVVASLRKTTRALLDTHLMIEDPDTYAPRFIQAGSDSITVHQEACVHLNRTLRMIRGEGAKAGVAINPATPLGTLEEVLDLVDLVLVMSVNPGFGGQKFIPNSIDKVRRLARRRRELGLQFIIEIDGGVTRENVAALVDAGVDWLVAGSSVFHTVNPAASFEELRQVARDGATVKV